MINRISRMFFVAAVGFSGLCLALPTQPATQTQALEAKVTAVQGQVQLHQAPGQPWTVAMVGMTVGEQGEFRTGPKSAVQFQIGDDQIVTLDRLGVVKVVEAVNINGKEQTSIGMKYGRTRFDIEAAGREHDASISSPSATLAVRGTVFMDYDQRPFHAEGVSFDGTVNFKDGKKQVNFGAHNGGKSTINIDQPSAAATALADTTSDPTLAFARSDSEAPIIDRLLSTGATVTFDQKSQITVVTGGVPPTDKQLIPDLPGVLDIVARWHTDADLNLSLSTPGGHGGQLLYPIGALATNSTGGKVAFDHRGGPHGGIEIIYFPTTKIPDGAYSIGLTLVRGANNTPAQVDVFENGQRQPFFNGSGFVTTASVQVPKPVPGFVDSLLVGTLFEGINIPGSANATSTVKPASTDTTNSKTSKPAATDKPVKHK